MPVLPVWGLAIPLPAVLMITVSLYMLVLGIGLGIRYCLKDYCSPECARCCPNMSVCDQCFTLAEMCNCRLPNFSLSLPNSCSPPSCVPLDCPCACTCQPPECNSCNCLCFEIRIK
ncbi:uncharacterized protein PAE49_022967 [Odontesthes bonariensis]